MRLRLTHLLALEGVGLDPRPADALAVVEGEPLRRIFVPGWLPCGECGPCRRALVSACARGKTLAAAGVSATALLDDPGRPAPLLELADRFLTPIDEPAGLPALADELAVCAGVVAELIEAAGRVALGPGDRAIWIGDDPRCLLGARLAAGMGCRSFHLGGGPLAPTDPALGSSGGVTSLTLADPPSRWQEALGAEPAPASASASSAHGADPYSEFRLFLAGADPILVGAATALARAGTRLTLLTPGGGGLLDPGALPGTRILVGAGRGYHPDFVPEALAALRRGDLVLADLVALGPGAPHPTPAPTGRLVISALRG